MTIVRGLDVSHFRPGYDFRAAYAKGARFAGVQLTIGTGDDALGTENVKGALDAGMYVLPYGFTDGSAPGRDQCDHFLDRFHALPQRERLYPVQDIEPKEGATAQKVIDWFTRWFALDAGRLGEYSGPGAFAAVFKPMGGRRFDLASMFPGIGLRWSADYRGPRVTTSDDPRFDMFFSAASRPAYGYGGWTAAQIVQDGPMFGTDGDAFAGSEYDLGTLFGRFPVTQPPTVKYRYGALPHWRGAWVTVMNAPVRRAPGVGSPRVTTLQPGVTFHVYQSLKRANGRLWLGDETGRRWILADGRVKQVS